MGLRLFFKVPDMDQVCATALAVPNVGDSVWVKTLHEERMYLVQRIEHQLDRSNADTYANHDVLLYCEDITRSDDEE